MALIISREQFSKCVGTPRQAEKVEKSVRCGFIKKTWVAKIVYVQFLLQVATGGNRMDFVNKAAKIASISKRM